MSQNKQHPTQEQLTQFVDSQLNLRKERTTPLSEMEKELIEKIKTAKTLEEVMDLIKQAPEI
ncbi:hypothetical protein [Acinetobacter sp. YH01003]|uniref:hypothetical protein n=1 Tax=Acinetobacter sp. YH01003 TaxID=2601019 RepID=UPI001C55624D|nr:hypothetical protein [Acinetobacter sp. YH01003]